MAEEEAKTIPIEFGPGIVYEMRQPTDEQVSVAISAIQTAQRDPTRWMRGIEMYFRFIGKMLVDPADEDRLADDMMEGRVTFENLTSAIESLIGGTSGSKAPVKRARRTRS